MARMNTVALAQKLAGKHGQAPDLLLRIIYWSGRGGIEKKGHRWVVKSRQGWLDDTGLTLHQYKYAISHLVEMGLVETTRGLFRNKVTPFLRLSEHVLKQLHEAKGIANSANASAVSSASQMTPNSASQEAVVSANPIKRHYGDNTSYNTTEITGVLTHATSGQEPEKEEAPGEKETEKNSDTDRTNNTLPTTRRYTIMNSPPKTNPAPDTNSAPKTETPPAAKNPSTPDVTPDMLPDTGQASPAPGGSMPKGGYSAKAVVKPKPVVVGAPDKVMTLVKLWEVIVADEFSKFVKPPTVAEIGQLKCFMKVCPAGTAPAVLEAVLRNWTGFAKMAQTVAGLKDIPVEPYIGFLLKYAEVAVNFWLGKTKKKAGLSGIKPAKPAAPAPLPATPPPVSEPLPSVSDVLAILDGRR